MSASIVSNAISKRSAFTARIIIHFSLLPCCNVIMFVFSWYFLNLKDLKEGNVTANLVSTGGFILKNRLSFVSR